MGSPWPSPLAQASPEFLVGRIFSDILILKEILALFVKSSRRRPLNAPRNQPLGAHGSWHPRPFPHH